MLRRWWWDYKYVPVTRQEVYSRMQVDGKVSVEGQVGEVG